MAAVPVLSGKQSQRLIKLCGQYFTVSSVPLNLDAITALIDVNATCYGLKGKQNYVKGFIDHHKRYPNVRYEVLGFRTGKDIIGEWVECDFIRYWDDAKSVQCLSVNSKEAGFTERIRFNQKDLITEITKYNINDGYKHTEHDAKL
mmetsp:Transcript_52211/g.83172  ORF Transcript_52211/g.83172 Transcript_52211/m.83172 type:complete len:146 (-) Transcript_52211:120-557(-)